MQKLRKHKRACIRSIAYKRLGSADYIDDLLIDKGRDVRIQALENCPVFYKGLSSLAAERSGWLLRLVAQKMPIEFLPFIIGHKMFQGGRQSWYAGSVKQIVEQRIESYNEETKA